MSCPSIWGGERGKSMKTILFMYFYDHFCTHSIVLLSRTYLNSLFIRKTGDIMLKTFLRLSHMITTIYFCRKICDLPELLRKTKISRWFIICISFSLSYIFKGTHPICLPLAFWYFMYFSDISNKNFSEFVLVFYKP